MNGKIKSLFSCILIVSFMTIMSCASLGSKANISRPGALSKINCISLTEPVLMQKDGKNKIEISDKLWYDNARHRILYAVKEHGLESMICNDSLRGIIENITLEQNDPTLYDRALQIDQTAATAVLRTELEIKVGDNHKGDSNVIMRLHDIETDEIILDIEFNTKWGVNYVTKPTVIMTIRDGISGAMGKLAESMNRVM